MCGGDWRALLQQRVETWGCSEVARELGVSRPAVSMLVNGKYPGNTDKMAERIMEAYGRLECPHTGRKLTRIQCAELACRELPTSSPAALRQWRACKTCTYNPNNNGEHNDCCKNGTSA